MEQRYIVGDWVKYMGVNPSRYAWVDAVEGQMSHSNQARICMTQTVLK